MKIVWASAKLKLDGHEGQLSFSAKFHMNGWSGQGSQGLFHLFQSDIQFMFEIKLGINQIATEKIEYTLCVCCTCFRVT